MAFGKKKNKKGNKQVEGNVVIHKVAPGENVLYPPREGSVLKEMSTAIACTVVALVLVGFIVSHKSIAIAGYNYGANDRVAEAVEQQPAQQEDQQNTADVIADEEEPVEDDESLDEAEDESGAVTPEDETGDYILPGSDTRAIDDSEIQNMSSEELSRARNEIYARHGRLFRDQGLQDYFNSKSWYNGTIPPDSFTEGMLSDLERANIDKIIAMESAKGYR